MPVFNLHPVLHALGSDGVWKCGLSSVLIPHMAELAGIFGGLGSLSRTGTFCLTDLLSMAAMLGWLLVHLFPLCAALLSWPASLPPHLHDEKVGVPRGPEAGTTTLCEAKVVLVAQSSEGFSVLFGKLLIREIVPYVLSVLWF